MLALCAVLACNFSVVAIEAEDVAIDGGELLSPRVSEALRSIAALAGESRIAISDHRRTTSMQASVVLDYYIECTAYSSSVRARKEQGECGTGLALAVYDDDCDGFVDEYDPGADRETNVQAMARRMHDDLLELGDDRGCLTHVIVEGVSSRNQAVDIKPSSISNHQKFYDAVYECARQVSICQTLDLERFYFPSQLVDATSPVVDSAFHIEFARAPSECLSIC